MLRACSMQFLQSDEVVGLAAAYRLVRHRTTGEPLRSNTAVTLGRRDASLPEGFKPIAGGAAMANNPPTRMARCARRP